MAVPVKTGIATGAVFGSHTVDASALLTANVTALSIDQVDTAGGDFVEITVDANGLSATGVTFGGTAARSFVGLSATKVLAEAPAKTAGLHAVQVTTSGGGGTTMNVEAWSPAELSLTGFWDRGNYQDVAMGTWPGRPSAGTSGGRNLTQATAAFRPAEVNLEPDFDGVDDLIVGDTMANLVAASAGTVCVLFAPDVEGPVTGLTAPYSADGLVNDVSGAGFHLGYALVSSVQSVQSGYHDGVSWNSVAVAAQTGRLHLAQTRWNGTTLELRVNGGAWSNVARGPLTIAGSMQVGKNYDPGTFLDGRVRAVLISNTILTDALLDKMVKWARNSRGLEA